MTAVIVGTSSTQSRGRRPGKPVTLTHCSGVYEYSSDGRKILSWPMGNYGPLLGYPSEDNPFTDEWSSHFGDYMYDGHLSLGSYAPKVEQQLADKLASIYAPYLRHKDIGVRFFSNGTDATQAAVALCRYATHRDMFTSIGYHGGSSPVFAFNPQRHGVLQSNTELRFDCNFADADDNDFEHDACVIVEVPSVEDELQAAKTLKHIESMCIADEVPLIMDEIVTGFRFSPAGALEYYSRLLPHDNPFPTDGLGRPHTTIQADFICLGKSLSTYGKVSALLGPLDAMEALIQYVFASYTYNDHPLGFYDALWTLEQYEKHSDRLYGDWTDFQRDGTGDDASLPATGRRLLRELNLMFQQNAFPAKCIGHPSRSAIVATDDSGMLDILLARVIDEHDVLLHRPNFTTLSHNLSHVDQTLSAVESVLKSF